MNDDIPELTGKKQEMDRINFECVQATMQGYAKGVSLINPRVGKVLTIAVNCLTKIARKGDCACPVYARRALFEMAGRTP